MEIGGGGEGGQSHQFCAPRPAGTARQKRRRRDRGAKFCQFTVYHDGDAYYDCIFRNFPFRSASNSPQLQVWVVGQGTTLPTRTSQRSRRNPLFLFACPSRIREGAAQADTRFPCFDKFKGACRPEGSSEAHLLPHRYRGITSNRPENQPWKAMSICFAACPEKARRLQVHYGLQEVR